MKVPNVFCCSTMSSMVAALGSSSGSSGSRTVRGGPSSVIAPGICWRTALTSGADQTPVNRASPPMHEPIVEAASGFGWPSTSSSA